MRKCSPCKCCPYESTCSKTCQEWKDWFSKSWNAVRKLFGVV